MKVLAVLGDNDGIDLEIDRKYLDELLGKNTITWLPQPSRQLLNESLWEYRWDIFFFAGHSSSQNSSGRIYLKPGESLSIDELKFALKSALKNGLKLAIFNSCDGLGLARDLAELKIPHTIVMREPVPDEVAQKFLRYFLEFFSQRTPLYKAVKQAREKLQGLEKQLPCASWLPVIYETPGFKPIVWHSHSQRIHKFKLLWGIILSIGTVSIGIWIYQDNTVDSRISEGEKVLIKTNTNQDKQEGVKALDSGECQVAKDLFFFALENNRNDPESLIYFNNSDTCDRPYFKIAVSIPIGSNPDVAQEILRGVAQSQHEINHQGGINGKLLKVKIANDNNDIQIADKLVKNFLKDSETLAVVGHNSSDVSVGVCSQYGEGRLVMISPTSSSLKLSRCSPYVFRTVTNVRFAADLLSNYMIQQTNKHNSLVCIDLKAEDNQSFAGEFRYGLYAHGVNINKTTCDLSEDNFNPDKIISQALASGADNIMLAPHVDRISKAIEIAKANRGRLPLFGSPTLYTSLTIREGKDNVSGMVLPAPWYPTAIPGNSFPQTSEKLWGGKVTWRTAYSYDAVMVIAKGLETSNTREQLQKTLSDPNFFADGATGRIEFSASGDRHGKPYLVKVQKQGDGKYDFVSLPYPNSIP